MGTLLVLKEIDRNLPEEFVSEPITQAFSPAVLLDFNQAFEKKLFQQKLKTWAEDGLSVLKVIVLDYERLMRVLATQITPEQLAKVTNLSADEQIQEDLRRMHELMDSLEAQLDRKEVDSLQQAFEIVKKDAGELGVVASYLEKNEYPLFRLMSKVIAWSSVAPQEVSDEEVSASVNALLEMGAFDSANALVYLQSRAS